MVTSVLRIRLYAARARVCVCVTSIKTHKVAVQKYNSLANGRRRKIYTYTPLYAVAGTRIMYQVVRTVIDRSIVVKHGYSSVACEHTVHPQWKTANSCEEDACALWMAEKKKIINFTEVPLVLWVAMNLFYGKHTTAVVISTRMTRDRARRYRGTSRRVNVLRFDF